MRWLDGISNAMNMNLGKLQEMVRDKESRRVRQDCCQTTNFDLLFSFLLLIFTFVVIPRKYSSLK